MSSSQPTKILLLGAGELGTALLPHLLTPTITLTLGVRSFAAHIPLIRTHPSLDLISIDTTAPSADLVSTFSQYDVLISATGFGQDPSVFSKLAREVLEAGKLREERGEGRLWFFPWQWGVDYDVTGDGAGLMPLFGEQKRVRDLMREKAEESNVKWTVMSTGIFMSFLFEGSWGIVHRSQEAGKGGKITVRALRDWGHKVTVTDVQDIGRVLACVLAGDVDAENKVVYVAGDTVSYGELADIISKVTGKEVERVAWSIPHLEEEVAKDPEDGLKKYRLVFARDGVWWEKEKTVNAKFGLAMSDVQTYARKLFGIHN
jgi:hypothetical protein